jgi:transcription antitermination factor NusB
LPKLQQIVKNQQDPRHLHRIQLMRSLFAKSLSPSTPDPEIDPIIATLPKIDSQITTYAPRWPIDQINKIDLAILRLSIWELSCQQTPPKVIIDEAVEMAKTFGNDASPSFINGVLGAVLKTLSHDRKTQTS